MRVGRDLLFPDSMDRLIAAAAWRLGLREARERRLIGRAVPVGAVAVDVGANIGLHTLALARQVEPSGRVHALEPEPHNFRALARAVESAGLQSVVRLHQAAAGPASGSATLHVAAGNRGDHRLAAAERPRATRAVRAVRLDELLSGEERVDFVKIDVQGGEPGVLRGLRETLKRSPGAVVLCELSPALLERAGATRSDFFALLRDLDLAPHTLRRDGSLEPVGEDRCWALAETEEVVNFAWQRPEGGAPASRRT